MDRNLVITNLKKACVGDSIILQGKVAPCPKRFAINLGQDDSNYLIHFNPRLECDELFLYNSKKDGHWGLEKTYACFPSCQGEEETKKLTITNLKACVGDSIVVRGRIAPCAKRFAINLGQDDSNYLIHFNPRFERNEVIVYNSKKDGRWGSEKTDSCFPFCLGEEETKITFTLCRDEVTVIYPNNRRYSFKPPTCLNSIEYISVDGDFEVRCIDIK